MQNRDGRTVLMDFGGGAELSPAGEGAPLSRGTPVMLAPEVLRGEPATAASDIYSLGVLLYWLVGGRYPVEGEDALDIARRHRVEQARPLRELRPELPETLSAVVQRAIDPDPRRRPASAVELERELGALVAGKVPQRRGMAIAAAALAAVLLAGLAAYRFGGAHGSEGAAGATRPRPAVAVLGLQDLSGRRGASWLSTALAELLAAELASGDALRSVSGEQVARAERELSLVATGALPAAAARRLRQNLSADYVVLGSHRVVPGAAGRLRLDLHLQDTLSGKTLLAASEAGSEADLFALAARAGRRLRGRLGAAGGSDWRRLHAALPRRVEAARLYAEGLRRLRGLDAAAARVALERAVAAEPEFAPAHAALAAAWQGLGHEERARRYAARAVARSADLPERARRGLEAQWREAAYQWAAAAEIHRSLWRAWPDDLDAGLRLASALTQARRGQAALDTLEALRRLPPPASESVWIDLGEAAAASTLQADRRAQAASARAAAKAKTTGARLLYARARIAEGAAWARLDEPDAALLAAAEAAPLFAALGDRDGLARSATLRAAVLQERGELAASGEAYEQARVLFAGLGDAAGLADVEHGLGVLRERQGDKAGARSRYERSLVLYRALGHRRGEAVALNNLAALLRQAGDLDAAAATFGRALTVSREIGDTQMMFYLYNNVGNLRRDQGDLATAQRSYEAGLVVARRLGDRRGLSLLLHNLGGVRRLRGDLPGARVAYAEALALRRSSGDRGSVAGTLRGLAKVLLAQGDLAGARRLHEEALAIRRELGEKGGVAGSLMSLAEVALEEGRPDLALEALRGVAEEFRAEQRLDEEAYAEAARARALSAAGRASGERAAIERALAAARRSGSREAMLTVTVVAARLRALESGRACGQALRDAVEALGQAAGEAARADLVALALEARLARWESEIRCGPGETAKTQLEALQRDARARGFILLADRAARAARGA
jgi:Tfp pilus assembly protein PilF